MKITIVNGNGDEENDYFDAYLVQLIDHLFAQQHEVEHIYLRDIEINYCIGCFGCWVKKPGECVVPDDSHQVCRSIINSEFLLWAAPLKMGFPSALLKKMMDKSIPLIHPYYAVQYGEAHHRPRYDRYPRVGLLVEMDVDTDSEDLGIVTDIFSRTAINFKSHLEFTYTTSSPVTEVAQAFEEKNRTVVQFRRSLTAIPGWSQKTPSHLTVFNGSPRGRKGNTPILLQQVINGYTADGKRTTELHHLAYSMERPDHLEAFANAEAVLLGFPLYTDAMPGIVKSFIEALAPFCGRKNNPPLGFLVQSGFPESAHSRHLERYLEKLTARLGSEYMGTIVKGGCEGVRMMPEKMNQNLFDNLNSAGKALAEKGHCDIFLLKALSKPERYPAVSIPIFKLLSKTPLLNFYWDSQLKENGVFEYRYSRPYICRMRN